MPDVEKMVSIAQGLLENTSRGLVGWEATASAFKFQTANSDYSITIEFPHYQGGPTLTIVDQGGRAIEQLSLDLKSDEGKLLASLYETARRRALNVDATLDRIMSELKAAREKK